MGNIKVFKNEEFSRQSVGGPIFFLPLNRTNVLWG